MPGFLPFQYFEEVTTGQDEPSTRREESDTRIGIVRMTRVIVTKMLILAVTFVIAMSSLASPALREQKAVKRSLDHMLPSPHMEVADRLLKRVLDITYETLEDLGASREDLERVQQKRNYIQTCYFQAISCY